MEWIGVEVGARDAERMTTKKRGRRKVDFLIFSHVGYLRREIRTNGLGVRLDKG